MSAQSGIVTVVRRSGAALLAGIMLVGCGDDAEWQSFSDPAGAWEIEVPGEMQPSSATQDGLRLNVWSHQSGDDGYTISQVTLPADAPFALNAAVDASAASMLANLESQLGASGAIEITEREAGLFLGAEDRTYTALMRVGDRNFVAKGRVFAVDGVLTQLVAIDDGDNDGDDVDRFLDSLSQA